jgi:Transposase domain (DUF772)
VPTVYPGHDNAYGFWHLAPWNAGRRKLGSAIWDHSLRLIRGIVNEVLAALDRVFTALYATDGRPSIAPERLLRTLLLQAFYTIRSERR